jgi:hypothetical protein
MPLSLVSSKRGRDWASSVGAVAKASRNEASSTLREEMQFGVIGILLEAAKDACWQAMLSMCAP